jgi:hypothetical protein
VVLVSNLAFEYSIGSGSYSGSSFGWKSECVPARRVKLAGFLIVFAELEVELDCCAGRRGVPGGTVKRALDSIPTTTRANKGAISLNPTSTGVVSQ